MISSANTRDADGLMLACEMHIVGTVRPPEYDAAADGSGDEEDGPCDYRDFLLLLNEKRERERATTGVVRAKV